MGIGRPCGSGIAVGKIDAAVRQSDIVDNACNLIGRNLLAIETLDAVRETCGLLNARAGASTDMQFELTRVNFEEEVTTQPGQEQNGRSDAVDIYSTQDSAEHV